MPNLPETGLTPNVGLSVDPSAVPGGASIPFQGERFGISIYIAPSIPAVGVPSHMHPRPSTSIPVHGTDPRHVNIWGTS